MAPKLRPNSEELETCVIEHSSDCLVESVDGDDEALSEALACACSTHDKCIDSDAPSVGVTKFFDDPRGAVPISSDF